jgi:hypothetical protein
MQQIILIVVAVAAPFLTWGLSDLKAKWIDIPAARTEAAREATKAEHERGVDACNKRVAVIQQELSEAAARARQLAEEAEQSVGPTPVEKAALSDLCSKSASCRDRNQIKGTTP